MHPAGKIWLAGRDLRESRTKDCGDQTEVYEYTPN